MTPKALFRRAPWERATTALIGLGLAMLMQPWSIEAWKFFLKDLHDNVLVEGGDLFMSLTHGKLTPEVWSWLVDRAAFANENRVIHFKDMAQFA